MTTPNEFARSQGDKWFECKLCGKVYLYVVLQFKNCSVAPQVDEILTGATTGCTGRVNRISLISGAYATGDAIGLVELNSPTGYVWPNDICFDKDENVSGDLGSVFVAAQDGLLKRSGRLYRLGDTIVKDGDRYCIDHYKIHWGKRLTDRAKSAEVEDLDVREVEDREIGYLG
jgi:hypothetical protein